MTTLLDAVRVRRVRTLWPLLGILCLAMVLAQPGLLHAHEGHDHAETKAPAASATGSPRVVATSEAYQLVGIVEGEVLVIYLDRADSNEPVTSATLDVSLDGNSYKAEALKNGTYEVTAALLRTPGTIGVVITVTDGAESDLLAGDIVIPAQESSARAGDVLGSFGPWTIGAAAALGLGATLLVAAGLRRRSRVAVAMVASATILLLAPAPADAHEGHDHGPDLSAAGGNTPTRRPDGTIYLPKPSQRLLEVRTQVLQAGKARRMVRLAGRVVANPNFSGVVQSTIQGRYQAPTGGVPAIGTRVKAGDVLGAVSPSFTSVDSSDMAQTLGDLDQKISIARTKLARQEQLLKSNVVAPAIVDEARLELDGLQKRRGELLAARVRPEELRAPVDGVVAVTRVVSGQVVTQADRVFEIVDPARLLLEALAFDEVALEAAQPAVGVGRNGGNVQLRFLGRSRALQQQYSLLQFEVVETAATLDVGAPMTVSVEVGAAIDGLFVPKAALAQAPNGQPVVFEHKDPEVFVPRAVRVEPFDNDTVRIVGGLDAGAKIVVRNATLVAQVR